MKKTKMSDSEVRLLLIFLSLLLFGGAYWFGFHRMVTRAQAIEEQNQAQQKQLNELEAMVGRQGQVEEETEALRQEMEKIVSRYPSALPTEKVLSVIQNMEDASGAHISNINFQMGTQLMGFSNTVEGQEKPPVGYFSSVSMNYTASYEAMKQMVYYFNTLADRCTVPAISAVYDQETDQLTGMVTVNLYYLTNTGREYEAPAFGSYPNGVDSIFGGGSAGWPAGETDQAEGSAEDDAAGEGGV